MTRTYLKNKPPDPGARPTRINHMTGATVECRYGSSSQGIYKFTAAEETARDTEEVVSKERRRVEGWLASMREMDATHMNRVQEDIINTVGKATFPQETQNKLAEKEAERAKKPADFDDYMAYRANPKNNTAWLNAVSTPKV